MDAEPDEPKPAPRGQAARPTTRGASAARRQPASGTPKKPPVSAGKKPPAPRKPATDPATGGSAAERILRGPTRSVARTPTVGRPAAAAAAAVAETPEPPAPELVLVEPPAEDEIVAAEVEEPLVEEPVVAEPEPEAEPVADPEPAAEPEAVAETAAEPEPVPTVEPEPVPAAEPVPVAAPAARPAPAVEGTALAVRGLTKRFGSTTAVDGIDLHVPAGVFYGFVGPNGAGKTTTLSMVTGLLRPDGGTVLIDGADVWADPRTATRSLGVLPDRLRLFDRLTGAEYLQHAGALHGLDRGTIVQRSADLVQAFGLESASHRFVSDFSAGMIKKLAIAAAMIHSPRLLVLDEPFESVDPVSAQLVIDVLKKYAQAGGTVLLSSHSMDLVERVCDYVAVIADGRLLAAGPMADVLDGVSLEQRFVDLAGGVTAVEGMEWLQSFSD